MKRLLSVFLVLFSAACQTTRPIGSNRYIPAHNAIDGHIGTATIEEYITALPPFMVHEEPIDAFQQRVRRARNTDSHNDDKSRDYLHVSGDGTWPEKDFLLNRHSKTVTILIHSFEPDDKDETIIMKRVHDGWLQTITIQPQSPPTLDRRPRDP